MCLSNHHIMRVSLESWISVLNATTQLLQSTGMFLWSPAADVKLWISLDVLKVRFVAQCNTFVTWLYLLGVGDGCLSEVFVLIYYNNYSQPESETGLLIDQYQSMHGAEIIGWTDSVKIVKLVQWNTVMYLGSWKGVMFWGLSLWGIFKLN